MGSEAGGLLKKCYEPERVTHEIGLWAEMCGLEVIL